MIKKWREILQPIISCPKNLSEEWTSKQLQTELANEQKYRNKSTIFPKIYCAAMLVLACKFMPHSGVCTQGLLTPPQEGNP